MTAQRVFMAITKTGAWFADQERCENTEQIIGCIGEYNEGILNATKEAARYGQTAILVTMVITNIICYRWR